MKAYKGDIIMNTLLGTSKNANFKNAYPMFLIGCEDEFQENVGF